VQSACHAVRPCDEATRPRVQTRWAQHASCLQHASRCASSLVSGDMRCCFMSVALCRLGAFPQWHLQGLQPNGRAALVAACMTSLQSAAKELPAQAQQLPAHAIAQASMSLVLAAAAEGYAATLGREPHNLCCEARQSIAELSMHVGASPTAAGTLLLLLPRPSCIMRRCMLNASALFHM
jgi:hypothetical protein